MKVETETSARTILRTFTEATEYQLAIRAAAKAVLDGECQWNPVVWAVDALGEAIEDGEEFNDAAEELEREWSLYQAAAKAS